MREKIEKYSQSKKKTLLFMMMMIIIIYMFLMIGLLIGQVIYHKEHVALFMSSTIIFCIIYITIIIIMTFNDRLKRELLTNPTIESLNEIIEMMKDYSSYNAFIYNDIVVMFEKIIIKLNSRTIFLNPKYQELISSLAYIVKNPPEEIHLSSFAYDFPNAFIEFIANVYDLDFEHDNENVILWKIKNLYEEKIHLSKGEKSYFNSWLTYSIREVSVKLKKVTMIIDVFIGVIATILLFYNWETPIFNVISVISIWLVIINGFVDALTKKMSSTDFG